MESEYIKEHASSSHEVNSLHSGVKRLWIEIGFVIMVLAAIATYSAVDAFLSSSMVGTICKTVINTVGMVIIYYAMLRGMLPLRHPLTKMWIVLLALNIIGFVTSLLRFYGEPFASVDFWVASSLSLVYLPMGVLLMAWYRGKLNRVGLWMILRILTCILLPIGWFIFLGDRLMLLLDIIVLAVELIYAYLLRDILVGENR